MTYCRDSIHFLEEHPPTYPHYKSCGNQLPLLILNNQHYTSEKLRLVRDRWCKKKTLQRCFEVSQVSITVNLEPLDPEASFPYLVMV